MAGQIVCMMHLIKRRARGGCLLRMLPCRDSYWYRQILRYMPHCIKGDLDSIRPEVRSWYEERVGQMRATETAVQCNLVLGDNC
jgi:thiamine pyrophosphokinase